MINVVTGAAGHLGANLVRELLGRGEKVRALVHRDLRGVDGLELELVRGDLLDRRSLLEAFDGADVVYHLAAQVEQVGADDRWSRAINVVGTRNVVSACLDRRVGRLVHASSSQALAHLPLPSAVDDVRPLADTRRCSAYDRAKATAERLVLDGVVRGLDTVIVRPSAVIGPEDYRPSQMGAFLLLVARGWLPMLVEGGYDWVDARDVAAGMVEAARRGRRGEGYLLTGHWLSIVELGELVGRATGRRPPRHAVPLWLAAAFAPVAERLALAMGARVLYSRQAISILGDRCRLSGRKAERMLGYRRRPAAQTIDDTIEWFRRAGYLEGRGALVR